ncbi:ornithine cyclodeaminase family protein [Verminephrobacter aporrectodeae subsp. tuberculatae]|uniref:ornithine cyclodeaminase family protein n=1 Tax=Verminephrobacter aporrectodeae TaxID=1110389 RepID=UPI0002375449|nr:ornithine cyclodeaminase family protein [Verminephrobacter aporrectodeae]MCW8166267.1 ornithine cyclodeaminase family protein [Verminephrobacter aporrectodeae subsp. tuberculatae]MCW8170305.1 ornithine cyclodeaminase family protein [Verminephrobacter aporrectodeae subsp. tuberculatae]
MRSDAQLLLLDKAQVHALLQTDDVLDAVREAFVLHSRQEGRVFPVIREALGSNAVFGIKAGDVPSEALLGFKAAGFWPDNRRIGGDSHQATIILIDPATGRPVCIIDGNAVTTLRTGAAGALGLQQLARAESTRLCLFGTGVQGRIQLKFALRAMPNLRHLLYVNAAGRPDEAFEAELRGERDIDIAHTTDRNAAVAQSDVVITATSGRSALFDADAVRPGTHLNCVGTDTRGKRELPIGLLNRARVVADDRVQAAQIGESQWSPGTDCMELGDLLTGKALLDRQPGDVTVFDMTGLALQDLTVARMLQTKAVNCHSGTRVAWPW